MKNKNKSKSKENINNKSKINIRKNRNQNFDLKEPKSPYFLFYSKKSEELIKKGDNKKLSAKELGQMWKLLPIKDKKIFIEKYEEENKKYKKLKEENELREKSKNKRKNQNVGIKKIKFRQNKNNRKACNCGKCDECKKLKFKRKLPEEDLIEINLKQKHIKVNQINKKKLQNIKIRKRDKFIENFFQ